MPLLGWPLMALLGVLLAMAMAVALWVWNRVQGPAWAAVAQRVGMLVVIQLVATLLTAAAVNNYGYFYGSWSDLLGGSGGMGKIHHIAGQEHGRMNRVIPLTTRMVPDAQWAAPAQYADSGELGHLTIRGERSDLSSPAYVYLPPEYFRPAYAKTRFPVVEIISGYPGTAEGLQARLGFPQMMLDAINSRKSRPMVLVMLASAPIPRRDTECTNIPAGPQVQSYLGQDVPSAIRQVLRVQPLDWGTLGNSTGGYCAVKLAMAYSDQYSAAATLSGYYHPYHDPTSGSLWAGSVVVENLNSPDWLLQHQPAPPVSVLATVGSDETGSYGIRDLHRFLSLVKPPMSAYAIVIPKGGHNFSDWGQVAPRCLDWLSTKVP